VKKLSDDNRYYQTYFGIYTDDWDVTWGTLSDNHFILVKDYPSDACSTTSDSTWGSTGTVFLYPHNIKKKYFIEGVVEGQITFHAKTAYSYVSNYRVSIVKVDSTGETVLASTGLVDVNDAIDYDADWHTGDDIVYPFWIDVFDEAKEIGEDERMGVKVEWDVDISGAGSVVTGTMMHDNDPDYEDFKITIPFLL
jgi:hypothetical protein